MICSSCGDDEAKDGYPVDEQTGICWVCDPCLCGQGCGFTAVNYLYMLGIKTCEEGIRPIGLDQESMPGVELQ